MKPLRISVGEIVFAAWAVAALPAAARAAGEQVVEYRNDRLTVRLTAMPLAAALDEVARATGATVRGRLDRPDGDVTASFEALPLDEGLRRLLPRQAFALKYEGERVAAIELLDATGAIAPPPAPAVIRDPGESPEQAAVRAALGAMAVARENGMVPEGSTPLEAVMGRDAPVPGP